MDMSAGFMRPNDSVPSDVEALLPADPYDCLDLAFRIASRAFNTKILSLEEENNNLRGNVSQKQTQIKTLERRIQNLELELQESADKQKQMLDENARVVNERNALMDSVKKLQKDVAKLEAFKRNLMQTLHEDDSSSVDTSSRGQTANIGEMDNTYNDSMAARHTFGVGGISISSPVAGGNTTSGGGLFGAGGGGGASSHSALGSLHATNSAPDGYYQPQSSAASASPLIDGKEFFRAARSKLSYEQFTRFLGEIKNLNAHKQTREVTLRHAKEIFGPANADLYPAFDSLLNKHIPLS
eukprot:jgi/Mesvir1/24274/Mv10974-RA.1